MGFNRRHIFLLVTVKTELTTVLNQQLRFGGLVRSMARGAFTVGRGVMLELGFRNGLLEVVMAFVTQLAVRLEEQFLEV